MSDRRVVVERKTNETDIRADRQVRVRIELPRSPRSSRPIYLTYCTGAGWSSPNCLR